MDSADITAQLVAWRAGEPAAREKLFPLVYEELRRIAHRHMARERSGHTLDTTALVHEAYLKLVDHTQADWTDRAHFFAVAASAMRRILVDYARAHAAGKRGDGARKLPLDEEMLIGGVRDIDLLALDEALTRLVAIDPQQSRVVELRFFGGLTMEETAEVMRISPATVGREA